VRAASNRGQTVGAVTLGAGSSRFPIGGRTV
jgi:hypothetical protein